MATRKQPIVPLFVLSLSLLFLGINGLIGGYAMLSDPNGAPMGLPVDTLAKTPFENYTIPGLILILVWGIGSFITLVGLWAQQQTAFFNRLTAWTHEHWAWDLSILLGIALVIWLTVQVFTLPAIAPIQFILYGLAVLLIIMPLVPAMRRYYQLI